MASGVPPIRFRRTDGSEDPQKPSFRYYADVERYVAERTREGRPVPEDEPVGAQFVTKLICEYQGCGWELDTGVTYDEETGMLHFPDNAKPYLAGDAEEEVRRHWLKVHGREPDPPPSWLSFTLNSIQDLLVAQSGHEHATMDEAEGVIASINVELMKHGFHRIRRKGDHWEIDARFLEAFRRYGATVPGETLTFAQRLDRVSKSLGADRQTKIKAQGSEVAITVHSERRPSSHAPCSPVEVPEVRAELLGGWGSPAWLIADRLDTNRARTKLGLPYVDGGKPHHYWEVNTLSAADLFWVGSEMCDLLYATMSKCPDDVEPTHLTFPSARGLVVFAKPHYGPDSRSGNEMAVDAILWGPADLPAARPNPLADLMEPQLVHAVSISSYRCLRWEEGLTETELQLSSALGLHDKARKGAVLSQGGGITAALLGKNWLPLGRSDWPTDEPINQPLPTESDDKEAFERYMSSVIDDRRLLATLFTLLATKTVAEIEEAPMPRPIRRREQRAGRPPASVKVVYLRRPSHPDREHTEGEGKTVNWSHRWMVSAHLRNQPYGPGRSQRKLIMIPAHVRGPEDLPLVVKDTVRAWIR